MTRRLLRLLFICSIVVCVGTSPVSAQTEGVGLGAAIGVSNGASVLARNPVGVTGKLWVSNRHAIAGLTSFSVGEGGRSYWMIQADYLFHNFNALAVQEGLLAAYVGGGVQYSAFEAATDQVALRGPTGITYSLSSSPIDFSVEIAPALSVTNPVGLRFDGAISVRYYFSPENAESGE